MVRLALIFSLLMGCSDSSMSESPVMRDGSVVDSALPDAGDHEDAGPPPEPGPFAPPAEPGKHQVRVIDTRQIIPGAGLPAEVMVGVANNNLDAIRHDGRVYLAWRSAPDHFAGTQPVLNVISSEDELDWRFETRVALGTDVREPRFLELGDSVFLYISLLGTQSTSFDPMGVDVIERRPDGNWTEPEDIGLSRYVTWRTRTERGTPYMTAYFGGEHIYLFDNVPLQVELLTTDDGRSWRPVDALRRVIYDGGGSEADFTLLGDSLYGVIRNEAGDATGFGSLVCHAGTQTPQQIADWSCEHDPRKYDSPLMFALDGEAYLFGRRNLSEQGNYDVATEGDMTTKSIQNQLDNWQRPKRCSLWRYVQGENRIAYILDLPSRGDTCYAAMLRSDDPREIIVYDYSSPLEAEDLPWMTAQSGDTRIYRHVVRFIP